MSAEEATKATHNKNIDLLRARLMKKQTTTKNLEGWKRMTAGLHICVQGHHMSQCLLGIIKKTREKKGK
jgi:hypothetical protein